MRRRILIDTDPGIDDAIALFLAARSPEVEVVGVTTVMGNVPVETCTANALRLLAACRSEDVPVAQGAARPLVHPPRAYDLAPSRVHGVDGLGGVALPPARQAPLEMAAPELMAQLAARYPGELTIVAIGPLTNVALFAATYPAEFGLLREIVCMGGSGSEGGNHTAAAEYNFYCDPVAAERVLRSGVNLRLVSLDVTHRAVLRRRDTGRLAAAHDALAQLTASMLEFYADWHTETYRDDSLPMHDALAVAAVVDETLLDTVPAHVTVAFDEGTTRGLSVVDRLGLNGEPRNVEFGIRVDAVRFAELLLGRLEGVVRVA